MSHPPQSLDYLVTYALPYANGELHLGHIYGFIQADIWVRFQRLIGKQCAFISGSDAHGTPIMLKAKESGVDPAVMVETIRQQHHQLLQQFGIQLDAFSSTHTERNRQHLYDLYRQLTSQQACLHQTIWQAYDEQLQMFLPDRYVRGSCPHCGAALQYGDGCEQCGAHYSAAALKNPISSLTNQPAVQKETEHVLFDLESCRVVLQQWLAIVKLPPGCYAKLKEWFGEMLKPWDITRDSPYFGFAVPEKIDQFFYVWMDAPVAYISIFDEWRQQTLYDDIWQPHVPGEIVHFLGKDILYFHGLFWPALLSKWQRKFPSKLCVHGFLTNQLQKMSKSRGSLIPAADYLRHGKSDWLRYYLASRSQGNTDDIDFDAEALVTLVNADLVGKLINIASRCSKLLQTYCNGAWLTPDQQVIWVQQLPTAITDITSAYQDQHYHQVVKILMSQCEQINSWLNVCAPWTTLKKQPDSQAAHSQLSTALHGFHWLMQLLSPIIPDLTQQSEIWLTGQQHSSWPDLNPTDIRQLTPYQPLQARIDYKECFMTSQPEQKDNCPKTTDAKLTPNYASIDTLMQLELRVGKIVTATAIEKADKLLRLQVDIGQTEPRQIFAGIKAFYQPDELIGRMVVVCCNLEPRKMRFGESDGMLLCSESDRPYLLEVSAEAKPGDVIR